MTVNTISSIAEFETNGVTTNYPFYFKFLANEDLVVTYVDPLGVSSTLTLGTHYTVNGAGNDQGGSIVTTSALAGPGQLVVSREMEAFQQTSLRNQGKFLAETHEDVFDKLTMLIQQGFSTFKRALTRPFGRDYYDAENRQIKNLKDPVGEQDAVTKSWASSFFEGFTGAVNTTTGILYDSGTLFDYLRFGVGRTVDSIADLRLLKGTRNQRAFVLGYYEKGDGGGGAYYVDLLDTTTADNGGTVIIANDGARWKLAKTTVIGSRHFGLKGDGVTDDTVKFQALLDSVDTGYSASGSRVDIFPGDYLLSSTVVAKPNTHIAGVGSRITCRIVRYADYGDTIKCGNDLTGAQGFKCTDIEFFHGGVFNGTEPSMSNFATHGAHLNIRGGNMVFIERCSFYRLTYNIKFGGGAWVHVKGNLFYGVFDDLNQELKEGFAAVTAEKDAVHGHPVEWFFSENNFAGAKKAYIGFPIVTADGTYMTTAEDGFTYVMAAAVAIKIMALESAVFSDNYFGGSNRFAFSFEGQDLGGYPFNPFNIRIANNIFDPSLISQIGFVSIIPNCYAWDITLSGNTFVGDRNGKSAVLSAVNSATNTHTVVGLNMSGNNCIGHFGTPVILDAALGFNVTGNILSDYNKLGAATTDTGFVAGVSVRGISSKGLVASNTVGGGNNFSHLHKCKQGVYFGDGISEVVQSGNLRAGTDSWTAQTYPP